MQLSAAQYLRDHGAGRVTFLMWTCTTAMELRIFSTTEEMFSSYPFTAIRPLLAVLLGYKDQIGRGEGEGATVNFRCHWESASGLPGCLVRCAQSKSRCSGRIRFVISLGLDTFVGGPLRGLRDHHRGLRAGSPPKSTHSKKPSVVVQEGGYICFRTW